MTEPRATYTTATDAQDAAQLEQLTQAATSYASAAQQRAGQLAAYATGLLIRIQRGEADAIELRAIRDQMRDLWNCLEALAVGLT